MNAAPSVSPSASRARRAAIPWKHAVAVVVVAAWSILAVAAHSWLYDGLAVACSIALLASASAFFVWDAPPGREAFRLLGFFVLGQAFLSSGFGVIASEENEYFMVLAPTTAAFSFAVESATLFAFAFVIGAYITVPKKVVEHQPEELESAGPTERLAYALAACVVVYSLLITTETGRAALGALGQATLPFMSPTLLLPLLTASWLLTKRRAAVPIWGIFLSQAFLTFLSSMLGVALLAARDIFLAYVLLKKPLPFRWILPVIVGFFLLNPVKHAFRQAAMDSGDPGSSVQAWEMWSDAVNTTYEAPASGNRPPGAVDSAMTRLSYNSVSAHVYGMVEGPLGFELGGTYEDIPVLLIPRILYPNKPDTKELRGRWFIKLGLQSRESVRGASFALPASAEAYWNFGWLGVAGIPIVLGLLVGLVVRLAPRDPVARVGFLVFCVVTLGQFVDMLILVMPQFFLVAASAVTVRLYSRRSRKQARTAPAELQTIPPPT